MEKMVVLRSIYRAACLRSSRFTTAAAAANLNCHLGSRSFFSASSPSASNPPRKLPSDSRSSFALRLGSMRYFSEDVTHMPVIKDHEILNVFKDLMAASWDELPFSVVQDAKKALSKDTDDKAGQEALKNVFRAAEAVEEFGGVLISMKMELDDSIGVSGENVKPLSSEFADALKTVYQRYTTYLDAFGPDETYLRKKVETELGSKMIYLKMRCSGLGSEWGKCIACDSWFNVTQRELGLGLTFSDSEEDVSMNKKIISAYLYVQSAICSYLICAQHPNHLVFWITWQNSGPNIILF